MDTTIKSIIRKCLRLQNFSKQQPAPHIKPFHRIIAGDFKTATQIMISEESIINVQPFSVEKIQCHLESQIDNWDSQRESIG
jgi:hypothetical protein